MDLTDLLGLDAAALSAYVRRRLRGDEPVDPPLSFRHRVEPPGDFLIRACHGPGGVDFRNHLIAAIDANLSLACLDLARAECDKPTRDYLAGLAFLATTIEATELGPRFYQVATALVTSPANWGAALKHVLRATTRLCNDPTIVPFWRHLLADHRAQVRGYAYVGLANLDAELTDLPGMIDDNEGDPATLAWYLAAVRPGISALAQAARRLDSGRKARLHDALAKAGADQDMLRQLGGFLFLVPPSAEADRPAWRPESKAA